MKKTENIKIAGEEITVQVNPEKVADAFNSYFKKIPDDLIRDVG